MIDMYILNTEYFLNIFWKFIIFYIYHKFYFQGQEYTEYFLLEYQREDGGEWVRFRNRRGIEVRGQCVYVEGVGWWWRWGHGIER